MIVNKNRKKKKWWKDRDLMFYSLLIFLPLAQFCIFYIGVNIRSILMSFQRIDMMSGTVEWTLDTLKSAFKMMTEQPQMLMLMSKSVLTYFIVTATTLPIGLFFSYYVSKKMPLSGAFRVILYLPSILSSVVVATIYIFFVERAIPTLMLELFDIQIRGLLESSDTRYATIIFYNIFMGMGTSILMYSNSMSGVSEEIVEASHLDGASTFQEFWYITLPSIFPTIMTFMIAGVATIFTNQLHLVAFYAEAAPVDVQTYGYYFYVQSKKAISISELPILSAMGLLMSAVAIPLTFLVKWVLEKFGPSEN